MHRHLYALAATAAAWSAAVVSASPIDSAVRQTTLAPLYTPQPPNHDSAGFETDSHVIRDSYIVVLEDHLEPDELAQHQAHVHSLHARHARSLAAAVNSDDAPAFQGIKHTYHVGGKKRHHHHADQDRKQLKGYSGHFAEQLVDEIRALKGVKYVERDSIVHALDVEKDAPWVSFSPLPRWGTLW